MADRPATKAEVAAWQKAKAKCDACAHAIDNATRQKELADDAIERETHMKAKYDADYAALVVQIGGTPTPPAPGSTGDWTVKA